VNTFCTVSLVITEGVYARILLSTSKLPTESIKIIKEIQGTLYPTQLKAGMDGS
jgi:hypothetical protein